MTSVDFRDYVYKIADQIDFDKSKIILGGDHLGPLPWCDQPAEIAMEHAKKLVYDCVAAGYTKVHLDTSMKLGDDPVDEMLPNEVIAERLNISVNTVRTHILHMLNKTGFKNRLELVSHAASLGIAVSSQHTTRTES